MNLPTGTVTFLFTDIEGSTKLWEEYPDAMREVIARHDALLKQAVIDNGGFVFKTTGDGIVAVFPLAPDALTATLLGQKALLEEPWPEQTIIRSRMGLYTGRGELRDGDYFGQSLNRCARLMAAGHGGQTLLSLTTQELVRDALPGGVSLIALGEHRLKDLARPETIFQLAHASLPKNFPPLKTLNNIALPNNLPQQVTSFIGREKVLASVQEALTKSRLLTLTGAGGSGKSRLSLQAAADLLETYPDGVWLVELAPLADPNLVFSTVANVLAVKEEAGKPILTTLTESLKTKKLLLILDNCEHVLNACATLADTLIRQCFNVQILATSREGLGIAGEATYRVPSLSLPEPKQVQTPENLLSFEAVRLFIDRALQTQPSFAVTNANAPAVASICFRLDGIPLAIELAAARARSLSVEEINSKLDQRFRLLTGGSRTALPRQQTLRSLIDWSYDLLNEAEKALLCRLSVFAGGWTLESAEKVCADEVVDEFDVLDLLTSLVDKSLAVTEEHDGTTRYRMLETIRQYSRDRLLERGDGDQWRSRHLARFGELAEEAEPRLMGPDELLWINRIDAELDNLRAALSWAMEKETEKGLRLVGALYLFLSTRGYLSEGRDWISDLLSRNIEVAVGVRAKALLTLAHLSRLLGHDAEAMTHYEASIAYYQEAGDKSGLALALVGKGTSARRLGDFDAGVTLSEEALTLARQTHDVIGTMLALNSLGNALMHLGKDVEAKQHQEEALVIARKLQTKRFTRAMVNNLALIARKQGDDAAARRYHDESLAIAQETNDRLGMLFAALGQTDGAISDGDYVRAKSRVAEVISLGRELGMTKDWTRGLEACAYCELHLSGPEKAARLYGAVERIREETGEPRGAAELKRYQEIIAEVRAEFADKAVTADTAFNAAWQEGRAMTRDEAVDYALATDVPEN